MLMVESRGLNGPREGGYQYDAACDDVSFELWQMGLNNENGELTALFDVTASLMAEIASDFSQDTKALASAVGLVDDFAGLRPMNDAYAAYQQAVTSNDLSVIISARDKFLVQLQAVEVRGKFLQTQFDSLRSLSATLVRVPPAGRVGAT
jgi:hypothetical protein